MGLWIEVVKAKLRIGNVEKEADAFPRLRVRCDSPSESGKC